MRQLPLFLNDIAGSEILLILVFILIFFGSKSIPGIARTMGRTFRQIKDASAELQSEIKKSGANVTKDLNLKGIIDETVSDIQKPLDQYAADIEDVLSRRPVHSQTHRPMIKTIEEAKPLDQELLKGDVNLENDNQSFKS